MTADSSAALRNNNKKVGKGKDNCRTSKCKNNAGVLRYAQDDNYKSRGQVLRGVAEKGGEISFVGCEFGFGGGAVDGEFLHDDGGFYAAGFFEEFGGDGLAFWSFEAGGGHDDAL